MIAVFARPNHPRYKSQAQGVEVESSEWRYHGYVVVMVRCDDYQQALAVKSKLATTHGLPEPFGHNYEQGWYGGHLDLVALLDGDGISDEAHMVSAPVSAGREKTSIGDNRYAGFYDAKELL